MGIDRLPRLGAALWASPRARLAAGACGLAAALLLGPASLGQAPSDLGGGAARGVLAVAGLAAIAAVVSRPRARAEAPAPRLAVVERAALGRTGNVALLVADGHRLVVAFGDGAPHLLADLGPEGSAGPREAP